MRMAGYGRVSTDEEKQLDSLSHQKEFFEIFAKAHGHELTALYADEGISGRQLKNRVQFQRMLKEAELGCFDLVVVKDVSRFARNTVDLLTSVRGLKALGVEVLFVNQNQKILGESEFIITLLGAMAQEESANLSKRVKFGKRMTAQKGRVPPVLYGFDRKDNYHLEINPTEAESIRRVFSLYIDEGAGCRSIARVLAEEGIPTKLGGAWTAKGVRRLLGNPVYYGCYINHRYTVTNFLEGTVKPLPREEFFEHLRPEWAMITKERFQEAQRLMTLRREQYRNVIAPRHSRHSSRHLFSTLIRCKECGSAFHRRESKRQDGSYAYWRCMAKYERAGTGCNNESIISEEELVGEIRRRFAAILGDKEETARELLERCGQGRRESLDKDKSLQTSERIRLERQRDKYREMYASDLLSAAALTIKLKRIEERLAQMTQKLDKEARSQTAEWGIEVVREEIDRFLFMEGLGSAELRQVISFITVNGNGEAELHIGPKAL